jgi:hypothetical protein
MKKGITRINTKITKKQPEIHLYSDVCSLIEKTKYHIATTVNAEVCMLHWQIGMRIKDDVLFNQRAEYGKQIVKNLAEKLTEKYGKGWSDRKLLHCIRAAYTFSEDQIVYEDSNIKVAQYYTQLPDKKLLSEKLQRAIAIARENFTSNKPTIRT